MEYTDWDATVDARIYSETDLMLHSESSSTTDVLLEFNFQTIKKWYDRNTLTREVNEPVVSRITCLDFSVAHDELKRLLAQELETCGMTDRYRKDQLVAEGICHGRTIVKMDLKTTLIFQMTKNIYYVEDESLLQSRGIGGQRRMVPASMKAIMSLPKMRTEDGDEVESCLVCLEELPIGVVVSTLPCSHIFHGDCISNWLKKSRCCPLCRYKMPIG